jgi:integrase/recombinase XerD
MPGPSSFVPVVPEAGRLLTAAAYQRLADVSPGLKWFAKLGSLATRRAYEQV